MIFFHPSWTDFGGKIGLMKPQEQVLFRRQFRNYQSGLHELAISLAVDGRSWPLAGVRERGVWQAWWRQTR